jgi:glycosyltransferase involved in cell wall biosynthesis
MRNFSIIIPVLNEAANIQACLLALQPLRDRAEIIIVDGGSYDNTVELATPYADKIVASEQGRARQMNQGAKQATGKILLFLHADTELPEYALTLIEQNISSRQVWGRFNIELRSEFIVPTRRVTAIKLNSHSDRDCRNLGHKDVFDRCHHWLLDCGNPCRNDELSLNLMAVMHRVGTQYQRDALSNFKQFMFKIIAFMMNWRSHLTGIATGDQTIFVTKTAFNTVGGFPEISLMEDIALSCALKKISAPVCLTAKVKSSARRWQHNGIFKTILLMWILRLRYWLGADPECLAELYRTGSLWKRKH